MQSFGGGNAGGVQEIPLTMPNSLVKYDAPLFGGLEPSVERPNATRAGLDSTAKLDDMLNSMLPPREWVEEHGTWVQYVSKEPASRQDVMDLQELLDRKHAERRARETGICPVREELFGQCMDELIRQVTLDGPERGLLLLRTRDEIRMTIDSYKTLFANSVTFGIKKQLRADQGIPELEAEVAALEAEKVALEQEVAELRSRVDIIERRETERKNADDKRRKEEIDFLKYQGQHLDSFLKQMNSTK